MNNNRCAPGWRKRLAWSGLLTACLLTWSSIRAPYPCEAEFHSDLGDKYLQNEFDWAMYVDVRELKRYMNYKGARLDNVARARVHYRPYARLMFNRPEEASRVYEDFWYQGGRIIGQHRYRNLTIEPDRLGAIIISPGPAGELERPESIEAITNVIMRLLVDLQLKRALLGVVIVPAERYDDVAAALQQYRFVKNAQRFDGPQLSIQLRAYPAGPDEHFYFTGN